MIDVHCSCGKRYRVGDENAGKKLRCQGCESLVTIPSPYAVDDFDDFDEFEDEFDAPPPRRRPAKRRVSKKQSAGNKGAIIAVSVGGGVVLLAGLIVGIVFIVKGASKDDADGGGSNNDTYTANNGGGSNSGFNNPGPGFNNPGGNNGGNSESRAYRQNEQAIKDMIDGMNEIASALESVRDRNSARAAAGRINNASAKWERVAVQMRTLPKISFADNSRLKEAYREKLESAKSRMQRVARRAGTLSQREPTFQASIRRMQAAANSIQRASLATRGF